MDLDLDILSTSLTADPFYARFDGPAPVKQTVLLASTGSIPQETSASGGHGLFFYINDQLGTPLKVADNNAQVVWAADYTPFGVTEAGVEALESRFRLPGQYYDQETGLHYNWYRYYDPETGRYITPDPIGLARGINPFIYANANPINLIDPKGLMGKLSEFVPPVLRIGSCAKALEGCKECIKSAEKCRNSHEDPLACQERGENPGASIGAHILYKCVFSNPKCDENCAQVLLMCWGP